MSYAAIYSAAANLCIGPCPICFTVLFSVVLLLAGHQRDLLEDLAPDANLDEMTYEEGLSMLTDVLPGFKLYEVVDLTINHKVFKDTILQLTHLNRTQGQQVVKAKRQLRGRLAVCISCNLWLCMHELRLHCKALYHVNTW